MGVKCDAIEGLIKETDSVMYEARATWQCTLHLQALAKQSNTMKSRATAAEVLKNEEARAG